jgi:hypothetical protein
MGVQEKVKDQLKIFLRNRHGGRESRECCLLFDDKVIRLIEELVVVVTKVWMSWFVRIGDS